MLKNHPRSDESRPLTLHPVTVREIDGTRVKIGPFEAFDGTPVVDIKSALRRMRLLATRFLMPRAKTLRLAPMLLYRDGVTGR